ncbi:P-loop containing nucleoside triphosphate hydrolase protein [Spinellus fusiger]|nr:P-loop containing nucleoside triphosphate hydrolase protein [Spinellus fusiger]KAI7864491.1 P-loop containing nucleoside triphosphate hydrolase protein [Spinellus fusiger]
MFKGKGKVQPSDNLPWVEKYRPEQLDDIMSHEDVTCTIKQFIKAQQLPHLLFYGPPGTGKTSTVLAYARNLYGSCDKSMVLELNASDERGIDVVREQIKSFASTRNMYSSGFKLIILDEADAMTQQAQAALRRVIEKYTKNVRFCIVCNHVSKISPAIQSRCTRFRFAPIPPSVIEKRITDIADAERVNLSEDGKEALMRLSKGDMRRALNILQACHAAYDTVDKDAIYNCTGHPHPEDIASMIEALLLDDYTTAHKRISTLKRDKGLALHDILLEIYSNLNSVELPPLTRMSLLESLAEIEYRLGEGASEAVQLVALLGAFKLAVADR